MRKGLSGFMCIVAFGLMLGATTTHAGPWAEPGDERLRHDLQLLSDAGLLSAPLTTWPIALGDVAANLSEPPAGEGASPAVRAAYARVRAQLRREGCLGLDAGIRVTGAHKPTRLRGFHDTPRAEGELTARLNWMGERLAWRLEATAVANPYDGDDLRLDGSYFGFALGNWMFSASALPRWWGPAWDGSLILGTAARPVPALVLERNLSEPFDLSLLRWLGPWKLVAFAGQLEDERTVPEAKLLGARFAFKPTPSLEIGLSRTAQWGGKGRPEDLNSLIDVALGRDNIGRDINLANEPGNQLAGLDFRWHSPLFGDLPYALYGQFIGEDEAGGLPSRHIALAGVETWGTWRESAYRLYLEAADTTVGFYQSKPLYNTAYEHHIYHDGYRYKGWPLGHALDNDSRLYSLGVMTVDGNGVFWTMRLQLAELNRDGSGSHSWSPSVKTELQRVFLTHSRAAFGGELELGLGAERWEREGERDTEPQGYLRWSFNWH